MVSDDISYSYAVTVHFASYEDNWHTVVMHGWLDFIWHSCQSIGLRKRSLAHTFSPRA